MASSLTTTCPTSPPPTFYLDEKWKLSKKETSSSSSSIRSRSSFIVKNSSNKRCAFTRKCARTKGLGNRAEPLGPCLVNGHIMTRLELYGEWDPIPSQRVLAFVGYPTSPNSSGLGVHPIHPLHFLTNSIIESQPSEVDPDARHFVDEVAMAEKQCKLIVGVNVATEELEIVALQLKGVPRRL
ncbi:hypothetical protein Gotur_035226 [Gossypium turneri]